MRSDLHGLYAVTPDEPSLARLAALVEAVVTQGVRLVQYRNKQGGPLAHRVQAAELLRVCRSHGARLIVNDDVDLAIAIGADGVHVGRDDLGGRDLGVVRSMLGPDRLLGVSCYDDLARVDVARAAGVDYIGIGSMFPSTTKPSARSASFEVLSESRRRFGGPVAAIGGITLANAPQVIAAGADMVAVIGDLFGVDDVGCRAQEFQKLFNPK